MALLAQLWTEVQPAERRGRGRRTLRLELPNEAGTHGGRVVIRNLSETGLLLETGDRLEVGDDLAVELPQAGAVQAEVVWARAPFFGCEFASPVGRASISAALLKSPAEEPATALAGPVDTTWRLPEPVPIAALTPPAVETVTALLLFATAVVAFIVALVTLAAG